MSIVVVGTEINLPFTNHTNIVGIDGVGYSGLLERGSYIVPTIHEFTVLPHLIVRGAQGLEVADVVVGGVGKSEGMVFVDCPVPAEVSKVLLHSYEPFSRLLIVPCGRGLQLVIGRVGNELVVIRQVTSGKEVHAVSGAIVQGCIAIGIVFFALAIGGGEVAAPAFASFADCFQSYNRGDVGTIFWARVGDNLCR